MVSLEDKPNVHKAYNFYGVEVKAKYYQDVKEAVLKYQEYQYELLNLGIIISKEKFIEKWGNKTEDIVYKEIFGDYRK